MNPQEEQTLELAKDGVKNLLTPVTDVLRDLLGPSAREIGMSLGDSFRVWRIKRMVKLLQEVNGVFSEAGFGMRPVAPRLLFPILEAASLEDNDDLHKRWVSLLSNAARTDCDNEVLPSFPDILKQLTAEEVRFLDRAYDEVLDGEKNRDIQKRVQLLSGFPFIEHHIRETRLASVHVVMLDNLQRLGLLRRDSGVFTSLKEEPYSSFGHQAIQEFENAVYFTQFGRAFVRACRLPRPN